MVLSEGQKRAIALILKEHVGALFASVSDIQSEIDVWVLDREDFYMPTSGEVKVQLEAYESLEIIPVRLQESIRHLKSQGYPDGVVISSVTGITFPSVNPIKF